MKMHVVPARRARARAACAVFALVLCVASCAAVRGRRGPAEHSGFLGDYSQLSKLEGYEAQEAWLSPDAEWSRYDAVQLESVAIWLVEGVTLPEVDQKMLTDLLYRDLHSALDEQFKMSPAGGPGVIRLRAALTQAKGAKVVSRTISTLLPQALLLGTAVGLGADTARTVGTASAEIELLDAVSGARLAAAVDSRAGTKRLFTTRTFSTWGDVEAACQLWAERVAKFLVRQGVQRKPGAPEPG
jgi:hypothetical protein